MISGTVSVVIAQVLQHLATVYHSTVEALAQAVENAVDAEATQVWIVLESNRITITDNGRGMVDQPTPEDMDVLEQFQALLQAGAGVSGDVRNQVSPASRQTLWWMMQYVAFSQKMGNPSVRGVRGIGALAWMTYGGTALIRTKPNTELAEAYWGSNQLTIIPTYELHPPTREQLSHHDVSYQIGETEKPLTDPWSKPLPNGTLVQVTGLDQGQMESLRPALLAQYLQSRFGGDIREGRVQITMIDQLTDEGQKTRGGKQIHIRPVEYKGVLILQRTYHMAGGTGPFTLHLRYNSRGRRGTTKVMLRRKDSEVTDIASLSELDIEPFNSGKLEGFIDAPDLSEDDFPWDTSKTRPMGGARYNQWIKKILGLIPEILESIESLEEKAKERQRDHYGETVADALRAAIQQVDAFADTLVGAPPAVATATKRTRTKNEHKPQTAVRAAVLDEHAKGVRNVTIEVSLNGQLVRSQSTGMSGQVYFGHLPVGQYEMRVVIPEGIGELTSNPSLQFRLTEGQPGFRGVFRLKTGTTAPVKKPTTRISVWFRELADPGQLYNQRLGVGILEINTLAEPIANALASNDQRKLDAIIAFSAAAAVAEYALEGDKMFILHQTALLATQILAELGLRRKGGK